MEHFKISMLLNDSAVSKFVTRKWIEVKKLSGGQYSINKIIRFKTPMLRSNLCYYSDAYIVLKETIDLLAAAGNENWKAEKEITFKNNAPFWLCMSKINNTLIENAEDLDIVMPIYNLLKYSKNYSVILGSLWNYCANDNYLQGKSFEYKTKITGKTPAQPP